MGCCFPTSCYLELNDIAVKRGQSLAQLSIAWVLNNPVVTSALVGASKAEQIEDAVDTMKNLTFSSEELKQIDEIILGQ